MNNIELLLAGPGTGKTTSIKKLIEEEKPQKVMVLSFTNATINSLVEDFKDSGLGISAENCMTLHKYALLINPLSNYDVIQGDEVGILENYAGRIKMPFDFLCQALKCITYDRMITECTRFLATNPVYVDEKIGKFDLLVVDEFQDFNKNDRDLLYQLFECAKRVIILGDDDQAIYDFRDADATELIVLNNSTEVKKLPHENKCYRCPDSVVDAAGKLIANNGIRVDKVWQKSGKLGNCLHNQYRTQEETFNAIADRIVEIKGNDIVGEKPASIMVLSPVRFAVEGLPEVLTGRSIPDTNWFDNKIEQDILHRIRLLRALYGEKRLLHLLLLSKQELKGHRSKEDRLLQKILAHVQDGVDATTTLTEILSADIYSPELVKLLNSPPELTELLDEEEYTYFKPYFDPLATTSQLQSILSKLPNLLKQDLFVQEQGAVDIMTIHRSKGLQADYVFMVGLVNGILPNKTSKGLATHEGQRRLMFVGMSRARKELNLLSTLEWEGRYANRVDKSQFRYEARTKKYIGTTSVFVGETI